MHKSTQILKVMCRIKKFRFIISVLLHKAFKFDLLLHIKHNMLLN